MPPALLADIILIVHILFVLGVVVPVPLIIIGGMKGWAWVRSRWLRGIHLLMIAIVAGESLLGLYCPLTVWENSLRLQAGDAGYGESFIGYFLSRVLYYPLPSWVFTVTYVGFGLLVASLLYFVPQRGGKKIIPPAGDGGDGA